MNDSVFTLPQVVRLTAVPALLASCAMLCSAATLTVRDEVVRTTPDVLAYNLGHFFPGSNISDWWRYSRASGARVFLTPAHFNVAGTLRPGEDAVTDQQSFLDRRAALRADPLNTDFINWPIIGQRFNVALTGNNRIVPRFAFEEIHRMGGAILAQMNITANAFPIADENDWAGKWVAWRTFYSLAFYLAREFDVERFASHNEPNHPDSFIEVTPWLMRLRLASDAVKAALEDVNALYGKNLQPKFKAPVTAGGGPAFISYGRPAVTTMNRNFLGQTPPGYQVFHHYTYHRYDRTPAEFATELLNLRRDVNAVTPVGIAPLNFAITEYNVHTGANFDGMPQSSDTLSKATTFGAITAGLIGAGIDELYAFKFGMTVYPSTRNFPVQKNGMVFSDNTHAPHHHGSFGRSAEVYRLLNKGFAPGRHVLAHSLAGTGAANLAVLVSRDPVSGFIHVFSVNDSNSSVPLEIDLSALNLPDGNHAVIEDVSQWRTGLVRSIERITSGRISPGNQPAQTVWLIQVNPHAEREEDTSGTPLRMNVSADLMVRDGVHADTTFANEPIAYARNDAISADGRAAAFLRFDLPADWDPSDLLFALLAVPVRSVNGGAETVHAHLYGLDHHYWDPATLTWNLANNLSNQAPVGNQIRHRVVEGAGESAHVLGQITVGGEWTVRQIDVTDYLRTQADRASFMVTQDPRWDVDIRVQEVPASWDDLVVGDTQTDGLRIRTSREASQPDEAAQLILIRRALISESYDEWISRFFQFTEIASDAFDYSDGPLAGSGGWERGPSSPASDNPSNHIVVSQGAVLFDWTTTAQINNLVRLIWPADNQIDAEWVYVRFDLRVHELPLPAPNVRPGFLSLGDSNGSQQRAFVGIRSGTTSGTFQLGISSRSQLGDSFTFAPVNLNPHTTYSVTLGFHAGSEDTALWIQQVNPVLPVVSLPGAGTNSGIRRVNLRLFNNNGATGTTDLGVFTLDNLSVSIVDQVNTGPLENPTGDGMPNLLKFALGLDPGLPASVALPSVRAENGVMSLHFSRNTLAQGIRLLVERSTNLADWSVDQAEPEILKDGRIQSVRVDLGAPPVHGPVFFRLRAEFTE